MVDISSTITVAYIDTSLFFKETQLSSATFGIIIWN